MLWCEKVEGRVSDQGYNAPTAAFHTYTIIVSIFVVYLFFFFFFGALLIHWNIALASRPGGLGSRCLGWQWPWVATSPASHPRPPLTHSLQVHSVGPPASCSTSRTLE